MTERDDPGLALPGADLSPLAWVHGELRRSLEAAHKSLRRYLKESEAVANSDVDVVDPAVLRAARSQLHQGVGALELVGLSAVADVLRASEAAVQRMVARPAMVDAAGVETVERVSFALLDFLARQLAGKPVSPVMLFPQYRAAQQLAAADRVHPADLWKIDWQWLELQPDPSAVARVADDAAREEMETLVLALMRSPGRNALARMSDLCADLGAGARAGADRGADANGDTGAAGLKRLATFWYLAGAVFEAQAGGLLDGDVYVKRLASRLLAQLRMGVRGQHALSDRLAQDLLFFCSHAKPPATPAQAPRLAAVRRIWRLDERATVDYETPRLGRFDPGLVALARKRVAGARDAWSAVAGGELHRLGGLAEQFALVCDSLARLFPAGDVLAQSLQTAVAHTVASGGAPPAPLAMEVATSMLYLDACIEDGEFDHPELAQRVQHLARRIDEVRIGAKPQPLEVWMEELYRRVSDRQTMGSVVQELRASLSEVEKQIDQYFRNPAQREVLIPVPGQLSAMRGVLSVLGMEQASQAVLHMRDDVDALAQTEVDPQRAIQAGTFDRLANNVGALSFLIDMLSVQPQMAKSLFRFDAESGSFNAVMGRSERVSAFAAFDEALPASAAPAPAPMLEQVQELAVAVARPEISDDEIGQRLERLSQQAVAADEPELARTLAGARLALSSTTDEATRQALRADLAQGLMALSPAAPAPPPPGPMPGPVPGPGSVPLAPGATGLEDDAEMREIFIEEAREVTAAARAALERLADTPENATEMTTVRRAFHTLKGSSRMVGLHDFGEAAWACEQLFNARLAQSARMDQPLRLLAGEALDYLDGWADAIAAGRDDGHHGPAVARAADALRLQGVLLPISAPVAAPASPLSERVPGLPSAIDLDLDLDLDLAVPQSPAPPAAADAAPADEVQFDLDLGAFDDPAPADDGSHATQPLFNLPLDAPLSDALEGLAGGLAGTQVEVIELDQVDLDLAFPPAPAPEAEVDVPAAPELADEEPVKVIGPLRISIPLFNIFLNEADELSRRLSTELAEWALEHERHPVAESSVALAHSLAGNSATVGYTDLSVLARALEHALMRSFADGCGRPGEPALFNDAAEEIRRLLHQFAAGFLHPVEPELMERLAEHERLPAVPLLEIQPLADDEPMAGHDAAALQADLELDFDVPAEAEAEAPTLPAAAAGEPALGEVEAGLSALAEPMFVSRFTPLVAGAARVGLGARADAFDDEEDLDAVDSLDHELFPIFEEEASELLPQLQAHLREWFDQPAAPAAASACMRTLHTFKGSARLAGAMRLGEMAHRLETAIEHLLARGAAQAVDVEHLLSRADRMAATFDALRAPASVSPTTETAADPAPQPAALPAAGPVVTETPQRAATGAPQEAATEAQQEAATAPLPGIAPPQPGPTVAPVVIDWGRFTPGDVAPLAAERQGGGAAAVRVRADLLDRLVNQAGEVSITRARMDADVRQLQVSLSELTDSLERMRRQLRDIELQAETQITSRMEAAKAAAQAFDPLEMDRFTRFQELTRFMAESVNDVATVQRSLQRTLQSTEDELAAQARLTRQLQDDLLRTRMVEFESLADRLYRTVRQAAKETGKQVRLDIIGGAIEVDRGVLERMTGPFEHLLRNSVVHGVELPDARSAAGKESSGRITISVAQAGNEVAVEFGDDGAGLDLARIRQRGLERGLLAPAQVASDAELAQLIFSSGFSTADTVTELAGRGVGMDVVRAEVNAMGGRIETASATGQGTRFRLLLPLTTAVTQVVMLRCGALSVAVPSSLVEVVKRVPGTQIEAAYASASYELAGEVLPFFWLAALLQSGTRGGSGGRAQTLVVIRSASQRVALHVDEVQGNQEVVVKNVGPQLARLPGLAGVTLLPTGAVALIYNPVALATLYGDAARLLMRQSPQPASPVLDPPLAARAPLVLVVDDSVTVRRVTQRLLLREGYRVSTAKDGLEALERLAEERPAVLLSDIEMPRMDGFDLVRNVRADANLASLPVIMITSRLAQKHRDFAAGLGVNHYLGKPYSEDELLALVAHYAGADIAA